MLKNENISSCPSIRPDKSSSDIKILENKLLTLIMNWIWNFAKNMIYLCVYRLTLNPILYEIHKNPFCSNDASRFPDFRL
jgi:hypothetical protein